MLLADYSSQGYCFEFDPDTGAYSRIKPSLPRKDRANFSGTAQLLRSLGEGKVLVAQYLSSGEAWFSIGAEKWKLFDETVSVQHKEAWGGFLCELSLHKDGKCIKKLRYLRRDWFMMIIDPTYDQMDFSLAHLPVDFVPPGLWLGSLQKQREDLIKLWSRQYAPGQTLNSDAPSDGMPVKVLLSKVVNALISTAKEKEIPFLIPQMVKETIDRFRKFYGGLWVGGRMVVTEAEIKFMPNALNKAIHESLEDLTISKESISRIFWKFGFVTGIIIVNAQKEIFRFRCYGAKGVVTKMNQWLLNKTE